MAATHHEYYTINSEYPQRLATQELWSSSASPCILWSSSSLHSITLPEHRHAFHILLVWLYVSFLTCFFKINVCISWHGAYKYFTRLTYISPRYRNYVPVSTSPVTSPFSIRDAATESTLAVSMRTPNKQLSPLIEESPYTRSCHLSLLIAWLPLILPSILEFCPGT